MNKILFFLILINLSLALPFASSAAQVNSAPTNGLVGYWSFDEGTSTIAHDYSGNKNDGTFSGPTKPVWATGLMGKALSLGRDLGSYVSINDSSSLKNINGSLTISAWIYVNNNVDRSTIVFKGDRSKSPEEAQYWFFVDTSGYLNLLSKDGAGAWQSATDNQKKITNKRWTHVSVTFLDGTASFYVDGAPARSVALGMNSLITNSDKIYLGLGLALGESVPSNYGDLYGLADEIRIYNRALSATEIYNIYQTSASKINVPTNNGLVGYWSFDEGTSTIAHDFSGNKNNGTLSGTTKPAWVPGIMGKALNFDGLTSYTNSGLLPAVSKNNSFSISFWVRNDGGGSYRGWLISNALSSSDRVVIDFNAGVVRARIWNGSAYVGVRSGSISPNTWSQVTYLFDGTNGYLYINGNSQSGTSTGDSNYISFFSIGAQPGNSYFKGLIDEVRIYNRVLSASEVYNLYQSNATKINSQPTLKPTGLDSGLVGYWNMDNQDINWATGKMVDKSGNGNVGTFVSMSTSSSPVAGKRGQAIKFDSANRYINIGTTFGNFGLNNFSISGWIKLNRLPSNFKAVLGKWGSVPYYYIRVNADNHLVGVVNTDGNGNVETTSNSALNLSWNHFVYVVNRAGSNKLYINGVKQTDTDDISSSSQISMTNALPFTVGRIGNYLAGWELDGSIDETRVYNRALSSAEILQLYRQGK